MANVLVDPPPPRSLTTDDGKISDRFYQWLRTVKDNVSGALTGVAAVQAQQEALDYTDKYPANGDSDLEIDAPYGYQITKVDAKCASGSCTVTIKIGGTALGGGSNSVTSTLSSVSHTSNNEIAAGGTSTVTVSSNSSCQGLRLTIWYTRT